MEIQYVYWVADEVPVTEVSVRPMHRFIRCDLSDNPISMIIFATL